ncbi:MAG TPA: pilus assembly protein TadG-related protein [Ilumatobacteraceae bacterium]|jgi:hypothetical protein
MSTSTNTSTDRRDRGQAVMLLLAVVALSALTLVGIGALGRRVVNRTRAQTAADAAALAGTSGGREAAVRLAAANGGVLVDYRAEGDVVLVTVVVHGERAMARASDGP